MIKNPSSFVLKTQWVEQRQKHRIFHTKNSIILLKSSRINVFLCFSINIHIYFIDKIEVSIISF
jgi:hypothetical protein